MHYTIIGGGALGSLIAARLHHRGVSIALVEVNASRRNRLRAGLAVGGFWRGPLVMPPVYGWDDAPTASNALLLCVSPTQLNEALQQAVRHFATFPPLVSFVGGIEQMDLVATWPGEVIYGVTNLEVRLDDAGNPETGFHNFTWLGNLAGTETDAMRQVQYDLAWLSPTLTTKVIAGMTWSKAIFMIEASLPAITGMIPLAFFSLKDRIEAAVIVVRECLAIARAVGVVPIAFDFFDPNLYVANTPGERRALESWIRHAWKRHEQFRVGAPVSFTEPAGIGWLLDPRNPTNELIGLLHELQRCGAAHGVLTPHLDTLAILVDEAYKQARHASLERVLEACTKGILA
jgi:2-dehydropantoate 2-reductase